MRLKRSHIELFFNDVNDFFKKPIQAGNHVCFLFFLLSLHKQIQQRNNIHFDEDIFLQWCLSIRFLVSCSCTRTSKLLGFATTWISYQQCSVKLNQNVFDHLFALFIDIYNYKYESLIHSTMHVLVYFTTSVSFW